jgi:molybdenum cofactor guanylyltransferase
MGRDKAHVSYRGAPMLARVAAALHVGGVGPVVAIGGDSLQTAQYELPTIEDRWPGEGPLGGLITALEWSPSPLICVVGCDLPELSGEVIESLIAGLGEHDAAVARTDRIEPLCAVWRAAACLPVLFAAFEAGERAVHRALRDLDHDEIPVVGDSLRNVNTPGDLR